MTAEERRQQRAGRFPGFSAAAQARHWDPVTAGTVLARLGPPPAQRFFTDDEQAVGTALVDRLLDQGDSSDEGYVPVLHRIDARLAEGSTDGWHYEDMPEDGQAWRDSLAYLDADAHDRHGTGFAACSTDEQNALVQVVQDLGSKPWHGLPAGHLWSLWTRYACTAFYANPRAWDEMGFPGAAYPRGYKNPGIDALESFEVRDAKPFFDPVREDG